MKSFFVQSNFLFPVLSNSLLENYSPYFSNTHFLSWTPFSPFLPSPPSPPPRFPEFCRVLFFFTLYEVLGAFPLVLYQLILPFRFKGFLLISGNFRRGVLLSAAYKCATTLCWRLFLLFPYVFCCCYLYPLPALVCLVLVFFFPKDFPSPPSRGQHMLNLEPLQICVCEVNFRHLPSLAGYPCPRSPVFCHLQHREPPGLILLFSLLPVTIFWQYQPPSSFSMFPP